MLQQQSPGICLTIGNFDGLHLGHQSLIKLGQQIARNKNLDFGVVTFWPHPRAVLAGRNLRPGLTTREQRKKLLMDMGITKIWELPFTAQLANLTPEAFVKQYLLPLQLKTLLIGHDFSLGKDRSGNAENLRSLGRKFGFDVVQGQAFEMDGMPVSSTRLRHALDQGDIEAANRMLGRSYSLIGEVIRGFGRGASLGFPTANLAADDMLLPANGVYAANAIIDKQRHAAVVNIGFNPTFANAQLSIEAFLINFDGDLYKKTLRLEFVRQLRKERKFASLAELTEQIGKDAAFAQELLQRHAS